MKKFRKHISIVLIIAMMLSLIPASAFAAVYPVSGSGSGSDEKPRYTYIFLRDGADYASEKAKYDASGSTGLYSETVKNGELLTEPQAAAKHGFEFLGWREHGAGSIFDFDKPVVIPDGSADAVIWMEPVYRKVRQVVFYFKSSGTEVLQTAVLYEGDSVDTDSVRHYYPNHDGIFGWKYKNGTSAKQTISFGDESLFAGNDGILELYPVFEEARHVTFHTGEGSPVESSYVRYNSALQRPADPVYSGHFFTGWYTDAACTIAYDFSKPVTKNLVLYAGWDPLETQYRVIYWKQNANDDGYTVADFEYKEGKPVEKATYTSRDYEGFTLNESKSNADVIIKGDGNTIKMFITTESCTRLDYMHMRKYIHGKLLGNSDPKKRQNHLQRIIN